MSAGERERNSTRDATVAWPSASDLVRPTGSEYLRRVDTRPDRGLQRAPVEPAAQPAVLADRPHACARPNRQLRLVADVYTLGDSERETAGFDVRGIVWSAAGAADPVAAAEWVWRQHGAARPRDWDHQPRRSHGLRLRRPRRPPPADSRCAQRQGAARDGPGAGRSTRVDAARAARRDRAPHPDGPPGATATVELAADETVICTVTNAKDALDNPPVDNPPADSPINTPPVSLPPITNAAAPASGAAVPAPSQAVTGARVARGTARLRLVRVDERVHPPHGDVIRLPLSRGRWRRTSQSAAVVAQPRPCAVWSAHRQGASSPPERLPRRLGHYVSPGGDELGGAAASGRDGGDRLPVGYERQSRAVW